MVFSKVNSSRISSKWTKSNSYAVEHKNDWNPVDLTRIFGRKFQNISTLRKYLRLELKNWILDGNETHVQFRVRLTSIILRKNEIIRDFISVSTLTGKTRITWLGLARSHWSIWHDVRPDFCIFSFFFSKRTYFRQRNIMKIMKIINWSKFQISKGLKITNYYRTGFYERIFYGFAYAKVKKNEFQFENSWVRWRYRYHFKWCSKFISLNTLNLELIWVENPKITVIQHTI